MKRIALVLAVLCLAAPAYAQDVASTLIRCGVNNVQANCFSDLMAVSYGSEAAAGTTYSNAEALSYRQNYVTGADDAKGVSLPTGTAGYTYHVYNTTASKLLYVYPPSGGTINGGSANASVVLYGKSSLVCLAASTSAYHCGTANAPTTRTIFVPAGVGRAGGHGGGSVDWVNTGTQINEATLAASATTAYFTMPITGLQVGDTIESYKVIAQIESAGQTATLDADLRKLVNAAADPADSSLGTITQVSTTADAAVSSSKTLSTAELIESGDMPYVKITATTGTSTDIRLLGVEVVVRSDN